ncbi:MAG TPA: putative toxin-antitoxin system toxin component, PIN family [Pirellulales bacterium]|nr:putative toxin-antitoxin system toxin component, PIN family [Pirellulales bacterium]
MSDRAVFDCMIYLQAVANGVGPAFACFRSVDQGLVKLCVSAEVLAEVGNVLTRPRLQAKFPRLTQERAQAFINNINAKAVMIAAVPREFSLPRDPDDEPDLNLAIAARAKNTW